MAIELSEYNWPQKVVKSGQEGGISVPAGKSLRIETSPEGEDILDVECPVGKTWLVRIIVEIEETDV